MSIQDVKLITRTSSGTLVRSPATIEYANGRIYFLKSPFALKDEIKAMKGSKWHGYDDENPRKIWSIEDCQRNRFQLSFLMGEDAYAWFDRDLVCHTYAPRLNGQPKALMPHQCDLADSGLTYHYQLWAAEMGVGKTLSAQMVIEKSGVITWYWIGPKTSLPNIRREFKKWGFNFDGQIHVEFLTYEALVRIMDEWKSGDFIPQGVIFDESSRLKGATSQRQRAAAMLANLIREKYNFDGFVIEMSGTPSPKSPIDWWAQCEIAWPGYLREGSTKAMEQRLAFMAKETFDQGVISKRRGWKDDEKKCKHCGEYEADGEHDSLFSDDLDACHQYEPSFNEVAYMFERLKGLVVIKHKKDCLTLPDKRYRKILCTPHPSTLRVAKAIAESAPNAITAATLLRELSDGFQYREIEDGETWCSHCPEHCGSVDEWFEKDCDEEDAEETTYSSLDFLDAELVNRLEKRTVYCPVCYGKTKVKKYIRIAREIPCPKDKALVQLLEECEETGRIVVFAGFTGSVDRIIKLCHKEGWSVVRCDGGGFQVLKRESDGSISTVTHDGEESLEFWSDMEANPRVAFVANAESGGMSLTLVESRMAVYWSNTFKPEYRSQSEDRIHRQGMDENLGCEIVDLLHLPSDTKVLNVIQNNRRLELMTMGEFTDNLEDSPSSEDGELVMEAA